MKRLIFTNVFIGLIFNANSQSTTQQTSMRREGL